MDRLETIKEILFQEIENNCYGNNKRKAYDHLYGVSSICGYLALKNNLNIEIASIIGLLHDSSSYINNNTHNHAYLSSELAFKYLKQTKQFNQKEIQIVVTAIRNHSNKEKIDDEYSEILKDSDVLQQYLSSPETIFSNAYNERLKKYL